MVQKRFSSLITVLREIVPIQDIGGLLEKVVQTARTVANADYCAILHSTDGKSFKLLSDTATEGEEKHYSLAAVRHAFKTWRQTTISSSPAGDVSGSESFATLAIERCLVIPLTLPGNGVHYGVLYMDRKRRAEDFSEMDIDTATAFANIAAITIENAQLFTRVTVDELTGAKSRNFFLTRLEEEFERARRLAGNVALLMIDIDHFKEVNDIYGHMTGDRVLKLFASKAMEKIRTYDIVGRLGGDEFAVLLPEATLSQVYRVAAKLERVMEETNWPEGLTVSISMGGTSFPSNSARDTSDLISQADTALYQAKYAGRGQAIIAGRETPILTPRVHESKEIGKDLLAAINTLTQRVEKSQSVLKRDANLRGQVKEALERIMGLFDE